MRLLQFLCIGIILGCAFPGHAQPPLHLEPLRVNLTQQDEFAIRTMKVYKRSGGKIRGLLTIQDFRGEDSAFIFKDILGEEQVLPAREIEKIEFSQEVEQQSMAAQVAGWKIEVTKGNRQTITIPADDLLIENSILVLNSGPDLSASQGEIVEALQILPAATGDSFQIDLQAVRYEKKYSGGGGGPSGLTKGLL